MDQPNSLNPEIYQQSVVVAGARTLLCKERLVCIIINDSYIVYLPPVEDCADQLFHFYATGHSTGMDYTVAITVNADDSTYILFEDSVESSIDFTDTIVNDFLTLYCDGARFYVIEGSYA